jgi:hypothetical protein
MNKRSLMAARIILMFAAATALASDPWDSKSYERWTSKDVRKILSDSPWAKTVTVPYYPYLNGDSLETRTEVQIGHVPYDPNKDPIPNGINQVFKPLGVFALRWNSSLMIRRALYRDAVLHGATPETAARKYLRDVPRQFELVLVPLGQTLLPPTESATLQQKTYLQLQPSGRKLSPRLVQVRVPLDASGREGYVFRFDMKEPDGTRTIPVETTEISFVSQVGVRIFQTKFQTASMMRGGNPDLY